METKIQNQIIDFFSFLEDFYSTSKSCLKSCQNHGISINKIIIRCTNIKQAQLKYSPLEEFEGLQNKLLSSLHSIINVEVEKIQHELSIIEELFEKLCHKNRVLQESCRSVDFNESSSLITGTPWQPPLKQILQFASESITFGSQKTNFKMDLLGSILNSMQKPPSASEAQKNAMRKQKEAYERKQKEEKVMFNKFRQSVENKISQFIKDGTKPYLQFEPMHQIYRSIIRDVAETAGVQVFSFGQEGVDRYSVVYLKDKGPSEDELTVRRSGGIWNEEKAVEMAKIREMNKQSEQQDLEGRSKKRKSNDELSGTFYKQKYAHLIGEEAALDAAHKTNVNKSYGEVPSENKKDLRSIEQTMADIRAKKMRKTESDRPSSSHEDI
ncbi:unnamed protein product [Leptosia nina]|uniref:R3H domain-containing protein n=1 Tax=Leptosia nina TaxID=320188 RepID=A0AAV1J7J8_9NEOP